MSKNFLRAILKPILSRRVIQPIFEKAHLFALAAMNFGIGEVDESGESFVVGYVRRRLQNNPNPPVIFDVGANVGNWSLQCIKQFQRSVRLYAFEPSKHTFDQLAENLSAANGHLMGKVVFPFNIGLSDVAQTKMLYYDRELSGLASVYKRNLAHFTKSMDCQEQVSLVTLDDFCRQQRIERINFLKLDTEGHELNILKGAQKLIEASAIDFIQFEFGGCNIDSRTYFQDFFYCLAPKYKIYRVCRDGLRYITSRKEQYEIFITVNYLAEIREPSVPEQAVLD